MIDERAPPFDLVRHYTRASLAVILLMTLAAGGASAGLVRAAFLHMEREEADGFVQHFSSMFASEGYTPDRWGLVPMRAVVREEALAEMDRFEIDELALIAPDGQVHDDLLLPGASPSARWTQGLAEAISGGIAVRWDPDGSWLSLLTSSDPAAHVDSYVPVREHGQVVGVVKVRRNLRPIVIAAGKTVPLLILMSCAGGLIIFGALFVLVFRADRILKRQHDELAKARSRLEDRNRLLEELSRKKEEFFAACSHDLRSPLLSVHAGTRLVLGSDDGALTADQRTILADSQKSIEGLLVLINDLLEIARSEAHDAAIDAEPVDLTEVVQGVVATYRMLAATHDVPIETVLPGGDVPIVADRLKLMRVFGNLVANAIKHAPGRPVTVRLEKTASGATVVVRDEGPGIPPERAQAVFERFEKAGGVAGGDGYGLGLAIVREFVEAHGGTISLESELGRGTSFRVALPSRPRRTRAAQRA